jgi:hypothetical protein
MTPLDVGSALGNAVTSAALAAAGLAAFVMTRREAHARPLPAMVAVFAGVTLLYLAADESLELHDRMGRWLYDRHGFVAPGPVNHVDDLFVLAYVGVAAALGLWALPSLLRHRRFLYALMIIGFVLAAAAGIDALGTPGSWTDAPEEGLEACGAVALAFVFVREALRGGLPLHSSDSVPPMLAGKRPALR